MVISQYFNIFIFFSFLGWIYECIFCTFKDRHWENRGFLFGPICPIYGSSVVLALIVFSSLPILKDGFYTPVWQIFIICAFMSAVIEYSTSYILERLFHAVWWDYSGIPLNINGRICLPATCGFGIAGVLIVRFILPFVIALPMDEHQLVNELVSLVFMLLLGIDIAVTVASLTDMLKRMEAMQIEFDKRMQAGYERASAGPAAVMNAAKNSAISMKNELTETVSGYVHTISIKDSHHIRNIRGFRSESFKSFAERASSYLKDHDPRKRYAMSGKETDTDKE